jgi:hypothetical protein
MAFTVQDFEDLVRLLEEKPEWRERMRQLILTRELLQHDDPLLADLIWWKGDRVMVTEVSLKVDAQDVRRAAARARTLRRVGINATPTVIGREWATPDTQALAQQEGVEWMVGSGLSQGFLEFRQISDGQEEAE